jgi:hypothetical protein
VFVVATPSSSADSFRDILIFTEGMKGRDVAFRAREREREIAI